ncbi:MAG: DUF3089 domain-containing protein [Alphaproteobacteria bacterium]
MFNGLKFGRMVAIALVGVVVILAAGALAMQDAWFRMTIHPPGRFAASKIPKAADYSSKDAWALMPDAPPPGAWETPWGVDVFFIHSTSAYAGDAWNEAIDNPVSRARLDSHILPNQAAPFLKAGPVYAPRYRQVALDAELNVGSDSDGAFEIAYDDVLAAFDVYLKDHNRGRGIIVAGVGQGGLYATRLVKDRFQSGDLKERLAAAYIIDAALPVDLIGKSISQPLCVAHDAIHCLVAWKAISADDTDGRKRFLGRSPTWTIDEKIISSNGRALACVNPLSWTTDTALSPRNAHRGGAKAKNATDLDPQILTATVSARCAGGVLVIDRPSSPALQPSMGWGAAYKTPEYNLFYADIAFNAAERARTASAWLDDNARKPALPLPPIQALGDAPIHREDGVVDPVVAN